MLGMEFASQRLAVFIFGYAGSSLQQGVVVAWASHCSGCSCESQAVGMQASAVVALRRSSCSSQALEYRLSSCDT